MESPRFAVAFVPAPPVTCSWTAPGPAACRILRAMSWNCSKNCLISAKAPPACHAKSISPRRCRDSSWSSPRTRDAGLVALSGNAPRRRRPAASFLLGLPAHGFLRRHDGLLIAEKSAAERQQLLVQFVKQRNAGGNIELHDVALGHHVEHLDQSAQRVSVRHDQHILVRSKLGDDARLPIG